MHSHSSPFASSRKSSYHFAHVAHNAFSAAIKSRPCDLYDDSRARSSSASAPASASSNMRNEASIPSLEDDPRVVIFRKLFAISDDRLSTFFQPAASTTRLNYIPAPSQEIPSIIEPVKSDNVQTKKPARLINEDDYDDDDDDDNSQPSTETPHPPKSSSPMILKGNATLSPYSTGESSIPSLLHRPGALLDDGKSTDDARKRAQQDKQAAEEAAKLNFLKMFYTLEYDESAMIEQQKLDELDRQVEAEVTGDRNRADTGSITGPQPGSLSSANLGASSLMLKHLLARIDEKRDQVHAADSQLRRLISEVRKNRSKWASEEKVGQEELYEAAEKVLQELKAMTEYSAPFLNRVSKREAPNYHQVIKNPMDIGTMLKKLKNLVYKSKKEFVDDLSLIWKNCLIYNTDPNHFLRKKALHMQKQTESLVLLIPDIVIRDRAEIEAEERRMQHLDAELDGIEDSDDEPIMASRGRKAPGKSMKSNTVGRKAPATSGEDTPGPEPRPLAPQNPVPNMRSNNGRADSDAPVDGGINGCLSPPPGNHTPLGVNGTQVNGSQADVSETDALGCIVADLPQEQATEYADNEFKTWKRVTKKSRAMAASERRKLFTDYRINPEGPALLRNKADMRRYLRLQQRILGSDNTTKDASNPRAVPGPASGMQIETLAQEMEAAEDDNILPDYYDPVSAIPDINERLRWEVDEQGQLVDHADEACLRIVSPGHFIAPESKFSRKMNANMRQMQETRKVCAKIGVVKQMQLQMQMYQNQFQKYDIRPFFESDIDTLVVSHEGPIMATETCTAAFQKSIAKIFYHAGFEDFQPSALEAASDFMGDYFLRVIRSFQAFTMATKAEAGAGATGFVPRYTLEEAILHTLEEHSIDLDGLESYVTDDVERLGAKLGVLHERMKAHLADMLRPVLDASAGVDGAGAFNDGSDQFISGDFAEDLNEDFFGFRELGLDKEYGLETFNVPFHLLQNRMNNAYNAQNNNSISLSGSLMEAPPSFPPISLENCREVVGLAQEFFVKLLEEHNNQPLIEDDDLPPKQRFPKPRLPPSGKITSPRKRPIKEQQQMAKKKRKLDERREEVVLNGADEKAFAPKPLTKFKLDAPPAHPLVGDPEKDDDTGMMSPPEST